MLVLDSPTSMFAWTRQRLADGQTIGFVPTMGALHAGHMELIRQARAANDVVVVSIFVNPLQFNVRDDFDKYPRPVQADLDVCRSLNVDAVYGPTGEAMYPEGFETHVEPGSTAEPMEGNGRPGHFSGVLTVVTKLFNAVNPTRAYFGQKDYQQLAVIRRMVRDLDMHIEIVAVPTIREPDGLALSSRNVRLTPHHRRAATAISRALAETRQLFASGMTDVEVLRNCATSIIAAEPDARIEYVTVCDAATLQPLDALTRPAVIATAVWFGDVRLIDNMPLG